MSAAPAFVHLRLHTEYSLLDSVVRIPELVETTAALGMPAVAVTDQNNLFAMVKFYRAALQARRQADDRRRPAAARAGERRADAHDLLCKDPGGYQNVTHLVTRACLEGQEQGRAADRPAWLTPQTPPA